MFMGGVCHRQGVASAMDVDSVARHELVCYPETNQILTVEEVHCCVSSNSVGTETSIDRHQLCPDSSEERIHAD